MRNFVVTILMAAAVLTASATERQTLSETWRIQPATSASEAPGPDWAELLAQSFAWGRALRNLPGDDKIDSATVESLWYAQTVTVPAAWADSRVQLDFRRIEGDAIVFCNDQRIGELLRPGGSIDITAALKPGEVNEIRVFVTRTYTDISRGFEADPLRYLNRGPQGRNLPMKRLGLGITAEVALVRLPAAALTDVFVQTSWREKRLAAECTLDLKAPVAGARLQGTVIDDAGKVVLSLQSEPLDLPAGSSVQTVSAAWADPIPWELEGAYLYTLRLRLSGPDGDLDSWPDQSFGFREVWTEGRQVYLNGHVSRWRMEWTSFGLNANSISLLKLLGRNLVYAQNNPTAWWCDWSETPLYSDELLDLLDRSGIGLLMVAPTVSGVREALLNDPVVARDYEREMAHWVKRYRNHPAILGWSVAMNSYNPRDGIHPDTMGQRREYTHPQAKTIEAAAQVLKKYDATRLVYSHADGNMLDIASGNTYPNFTPLQEVEDYPELYARDGNMPYIAAEYALPYDGSLYKGSQFLGTEYAAIYFGNRAYADEPEALLRDTVNLGLGNRGHGNSIGKAIPNYPMYWTLRELYVTRSDRTWRTWGVLAWHNFNFGQGYGDPPNERINRFSRYNVLREPVTERPAWANPNYDIHSKSMQSLLVYIAGTPTFTDKTHSYASGEAIHKQIAVVWDGPGDRHLVAHWRLLDGETVLHEADVALNLSAGDTTFAPIQCTAPTVTQRQDLQLELTVRDADRVVAEDRFALTVHPPEPAVALAGTVGIWDPKGSTTAWVRQLGVEPVAIEPGASLDGLSLLIIGREALTQGARLPWTPADLARGLQVLVCEQQPRMWEGLGLIPDDLQTRRVFIAQPGSPLLGGLRDEDLWDWRGETTLLPSFRRAYDHDALRAPKGSNRGAVASVVLRIPSVVGFTPLLACEFDLDYSPLLNFRHGAGGITYCSLDLSSAVGHEPAATHLAATLLQQLGTPAPATAATARAAIVVGPDRSLADEALLAAVREGAIAVVLPRSAEDLSTAGYRVEARTLYRATPPAASAGDAFAGIGPRLLRWRDALNAVVFTADGQPEGCTVSADGLLMTQRLGRGELRFLQASATELAARYPDDDARRAAVRLSVFRLQQLTARVLTNAGVTPPADLAARLCELRAGSAFEPLNTWHALGPFYPESTKPTDALPAAFPGEAAAIAGDTNPNLIYQRADGTNLDFRTTVTAGAGGYVDLGAALSPTGSAVAYVTRIVSSPTARRATLRLGVDYFMRVWCNGKLVYDLDHGHSSPQPNRHLVALDLQEGENVITLKVLSGSKGFGFWANLSQPGAVDLSEEAPPEVLLYPADLAFFDPYEYHYW